MITQHASDIIDTYIDNYHKGKRWNFLWIVVFCIMAAGLVYFAAKNKKLADENKLLKAFITADSAWKATEASLHNSAKTIEQLKYDYNLTTLRNDKLILENTKASNEAQNKPTAWIDTAIKSLNKKVTAMKKMGADASTTGTPSSTWPTATTKQSIIYIQYMPGFEKEKDEIISSLQGKYNVQKPELIESISFNPQVKYFNKEDAAVANEIAQKVSQATLQNITTQLVPLKVSSGQIEIWMGKYKRPSMEQINKRLKSTKY